MQTSRQMTALLYAPHTHIIRFSRPHALPQSNARHKSLPIGTVTRQATHLPTRTHDQIGSARYKEPGLQGIQKPSQGVPQPLQPTPVNALCATTCCSQPRTLSLEPLLACMRR